MEIYALKGHKVICDDLDVGYNFHKEIAKKHLELDKTYTVEKTEVESSSTKVFLQEIPGIEFNSCCFEDVVEQSEEDSKKHLDYPKYH
mgnify:CR=1 FL=1|tara:strand:- start:1453 stop:1716 length:264 start_codon:yes stop_codon:yes gene_type:complete